MSADSTAVCVLLSVLQWPLSSSTFPQSRPAAPPCDDPTPACIVRAPLPLLTRLSLRSSFLALAACSVGHSIEPTPGKVIQFCSVLPDGSLDPFSLHGGRAVAAGSKWAAVSLLLVSLSSAASAPADTCSRFRTSGSGILSCSRRARQESRSARSSWRTDRYSCRTMRCWRASSRCHRVFRRSFEMLR